jgi:hypothetical protein
VVLHENEAAIAALFIDVLVLFFVSLHIQVFLGSRIIQNAADCLAEHSGLDGVFEQVTVPFFWILSKPRCHIVSLTPWSRVLLEKLTGSQLVKKFSVIYGIRRFITAFTSAR